MSTHVVILAAGQGKRMVSDLPKVAHTIAGRPLVVRVVSTAGSLNPETTVVVLGHGADVVRSLLPEDVPSVLQEELLGTGYAARLGVEAIPDLSDDDVVVVLYGDTPLLTPELLSELSTLDSDEAGRLVVTVPADPSGLGRIIRDDDGSVTGVVEHRDCTPEQLKIPEINAGLYAIRAGFLRDALARVSNDNRQGEYYLTDVVGILSARGEKLGAVNASPDEVAGINSQDQLADAQRVVQRKINRRLMEAGVWMLDPERTYIDETVRVAPGTRIFPGVHLEGSTTVGQGSRIGPDAYVVDSQIGERATVWYSVIRGAVVGDECEIGPYASLRQGTVMSRGSKLGTFVEAKNTTLGEGAKANHLAYLGDAQIGDRTNIGAGTITVNYDGDNKHPTEIGDDASIGSDTMLVAPVKVGDEAYTAAGSVITEDVPDGALAIERGEQKHIADYAERRKARRTATDAED